MINNSDGGWIILKVKTNKDSNLQDSGEAKRKESVAYLNSDSPRSCVIFVDIYSKSHSLVRTKCFNCHNHLSTLKYESQLLLLLCVAVVMHHLKFTMLCLIKMPQFWKFTSD